MRGQVLREEVADLGVVIDDQDARRGYRLPLQ
jgi:hypothetical protein